MIHLESKIMHPTSLSRRLCVLVFSTLLLVACGGTMAQRPGADSVAAAPTGCGVQDGEWKGAISFTVSDCVLSDLVLSLYSGQGGYGSVYFVYVHAEVRVENNQFSHEESL